MKLAVFYNICGISPRDNTDYYIGSIENLLKQNFDSYRVVLSSCLNREDQISRLQSHFGNNISYSLIHDKYTVNTTFNKSVQEFVKNFGEAEKYLYIDSGCNLVDPDTLAYMYPNDYGMVTCLTDTDLGPVTIQGERFVLPIGNSLNLHVQTFDNAILKRFGRIIPDIFRSFATESVFSFINAAVNKEWLVLAGKRIPHVHGMDGASSGFGGAMGYMDLFVNYYDLINNQEGTECGFGFEECGGVKMHRPEAYEGNFCKDPERLARFLESNIFLSPSVLNYDNIPNTFIR